MLNKLTLSDYTEDMISIIARLEDCEGDEEALYDTLEAIGEMADDKLEAILYHMDEILSRAKFLKEKAKALDEAAKVLVNKHARLHNYVAHHLKATGQDKKAKTVGIYKLSFRKGSKSTEVDESLLPAQYFIPQEPKPMSKTELKALVEGGTEIAGVKIVTGEPSLQIKM